MGLSVQLGEVAEEVETIISTRYQHRKILNACYYRVCKLSNIGFGVDFVLEVPGSSHLFIAFLFTSLVFLRRILFFVMVFIQLAIRHMESHLTENVSLCLSRIGKSFLELTQLRSQIRRQPRFCH